MLSEEQKAITIRFRKERTDNDNAELDGDERNPGIISNEEYDGLKQAKKEQAVKDFIMKTRLVKLNELLTQNAEHRGRINEKIAEADKALEAWE